jgi:hypothetical protein
MINSDKLVLVADGTPRDCPSAACGGQKDTAVIRDQEMGTIKASPLGRTLISGPVDPKIVINKFMAPATERRYHARDLLKGFIHASIRVTTY